MLELIGLTLFKNLSYIYLSTDCKQKQAIANIFEKVKFEGVLQNKNLDKRARICVRFNNF